MIELAHASRWYGVVIGVNDVTTTIGPGITALLGQNGAGKSTLIKLITGQIRPTTGSVKVMGLEPFANAAVCKHVGYCPEIDNFYEFMTGRQFVTHMARLQGFSAQDAKQRSNDMLHMVGMSERCDRKIAGYSKGMRQRIKLAQAMLHEPDIILLDEPLNGLDPVGRHEFMGLLGHLSQQGKCIVISSHILYEVESMTRNILLLHRGRVLATGDLRVIRSLIDKHPHRIRIETPQPRKVAQTLLSIEGVRSATLLDPDSLEVEAANAERFYGQLPELCLKHDLPVVAFHSPDNNMESVFQYLVGGSQ